MQGLKPRLACRHLGIIEHSAALGIVDDDEAWAPACCHVGLQGGPEQVVVPGKQDEDR